MTDETKTNSRKAHCYFCGAELLKGEGKEYLYMASPPIYAFRRAYVCQDRDTCDQRRMAYNE